MCDTEGDQVGDTIELTVLYEADGAGAFARIHSDGKLIEFRVEGQVVKPPEQSLNEIYRWLQRHGYVPDISRFQWLDRNQGHRRRCQVYARERRGHVPEWRLTHKRARDAARS